MISVIDYGYERVESIVHALKQLNEPFEVTSNEFDISKGSKIILPGDGEASYAMRRLHLMNLFSMFRMLKKPILGICLGMQILCENSDEGGNITCLGIFPARVKKFDAAVSVPRLKGFHPVSFDREDLLFKGIKQDATFYFDNSHYIPENEYTTAFSENGIRFSAGIRLNNFYGVQFHPDKSGDQGLTVLYNFINDGAI